jgi:hypothetical protein
MKYASHLLYISWQDQNQSYKFFYLFLLKLKSFKALHLYADNLLNEQIKFFEAFDQQA